MNAIPRLIAIAALVGLGACSELTSDKPVGGGMGPHADPRLIGVWTIAANPENGAQKQEKGSAGYMFVSPNKDGSGLHAVVVDWSMSKPMDVVELDAVTGTVGDTSFINVNHFVENGKRPPPKEDIKGFLPFVYSFDKNGMLIIYQDSADGQKLIEAAIAKHRLKGKVTKHSEKDKTFSGTEIHLSSDQKTIDAFFTANAKAIFTEAIDQFAPVKVP